MEKICVLLAMVALAQAQSDVVVTLTNGQVRGYTVNFQDPRTTNVNRMLNVFKGIPYAEPPMRYRPPVPKGPWEGVYDATYYRKTCYQLYLPAEYMSEDCLTLNIYAPASTGNVKYPVMINFQSGDFSTGSGGSIFSDGGPMAAINEVVVVTFSYRHSIFGFGSSDSDLVPGNMGLMDQAMAMRWVRENIEAFGGDSQKVTVFGSLAGAASITLHMVSPLSRNLFDQAILQVGSFDAYWAFTRNTTYEAEKAAEMAYRLGCQLGDGEPEERDVLMCLTAAQPLSIVQVATQMYNEGKTFLPTIDGTLIPEHPRSMMDRGDFKQCPIIGGFNKDAGTRDVLYVKPESINSPTPPRITEEEFYYIFEVARTATDMDENIRERLQLIAAQEYVDYSQYYRKDLNYFNWAAEAHGDSGYTCPTFNFTWSWSIFNSTQSVYVYEMSYAPDESIYQLYNVTSVRWLGATLEEELQFVNGYAFIPEFAALGFNPSDSERELAVQLMKYWSNFAKTGNPNLPDLNVVGGSGSYLEWPTYTAEFQYILNIAEEFGVEDGVKANECFLWNYLIPIVRDGFRRRYDGGNDDVERPVVGREWREAFSDWQRYNEEWKQAFEAYQENSCI